jgi:leucyl aminopeptidase (aminopeptidase T)
MIPALRLDYLEIDRRVRRLKDLLDRAEAARLRFRAGSRAFDLTLDLRWRQGHASSGLLPKTGTAGNLPSGEAYIVPYEGERPGEPSRSAGFLPVELMGELVIYRIEANRAVAVEGAGPTAAAERVKIREEPAYANLAELGLGVLAEFGVTPIGETLLDEKLGLHIAFGRSDHFGGQVGPQHFSSPGAVVHIDRVYLPATQPQVQVESVDLVIGRQVQALMRAGEYVCGWGS